RCQVSAKAAGHVFFDGGARMSGRVIELGLRPQQGSHAQVMMLRDLIDRSVMLLRDWLMALGETERAELCDGLDECRAALAADASAEQLEALLGPCLEACKTLMSQMRLKQLEGQQEMTALVA